MTTKDEIKKCDCTDCQDDKDKACHQDCDRDQACEGCQSLYLEQDEIQFESKNALGSY